MTRARRELVALDATPYYHCISRCVRRAFLCGRDHATGRDFSHRRAWIVTRIKQLAAVFTIDVAAYAVMSNHFHLVLRVDKDTADTASRDDVIARWTTLFSGPPLVQRYLSGQCLGPAEIAAVDAVVDTWRERLSNISWYMRCLNEHVARLANAEDRCTGRFWEGRFRCQALLDETALLCCMAYVDLNPIRAAMAETPEASDFTSIQERLGISPESIADEPGDSRARKTPDLAELLPFSGYLGKKKPESAIAFALSDYAEPIEWTGRAILDGKRGHIPANTPPLLKRLSIRPDTWLKASRSLETSFPFAIGSDARLASLCDRLNRQWLRGIRTCRELYRPLAVPG